MATLKLGTYDQDTLSEENMLEHIRTLNHQMHSSLRSRNQFRDDGQWFGPVPVSNHAVRELQQFLKDSGFMPFREPNGIFDYFTLASVRLFQEYIRSEENQASIGIPDGKVGKNTQSFIDQWKAEGKYADWGLKQVESLSEAQQAQRNIHQVEYDKWMNALKTAQLHYLENRDEILEMVGKTEDPGDTLKVEDWTFEPEDIHLIGIRINQDKVQQDRENDDLFVLLVNGMAFKFWGSTDPSQRMASRQDEAFLVEGQHLFRFGWHKFSNASGIYKALEPASKGVLVFRDKDGDNALTQSDISSGLQAPNSTINIHWSGFGWLNYSAGCQVIAGKSYENASGKRVDCTEFAAVKNSELGTRKTKGAYNVLADLIVAYSLPKEKHTLRYTLGRDEVLSNVLGMKQDFSVLRTHKGFESLG